MKKMNLILIGFFSCLTSLSLAAQAQEIPSAPIPLMLHQPANAVPSAPTLEAKSYILIDADTGKVLAANNPDQHLAPASTTKIMTMYLVSNALAHKQIKLTDLVPISEKAWRMEGSRMFVNVGQSVPVSELIQGIVVASGNDASVAMAEFLGGTEDAFAELMNQTAHALGMNNSHFMDSTGMPNPEHYSTARDLATLARAVIKHFPKDYAIYSQKSFSYNNITQPNRNRLLYSDASVDGLKTGHTDDAGYCLVASALRNGMRIISVVMGEPSEKARIEDSQRLLNYGFRFFETRVLYRANTPVTHEKVWFGQQNEVKIGSLQNIALTMPRGQVDKLKVNFKIATPLEAPLKRGQAVGRLEIVKNGKEVVSTQPLVALETIEEAGFFSRIIDTIKLWFHHWFGDE